MIKRIAVLCLLSCLLAACGNKGPLVLPDKPEASGAATPAATAPAATDTESATQDADASTP